MEKEMATHSSILAWRCPWGHKELGMTEQLSVHDIITIPKNKEFFNVIKYAVSVQISWVSS